jgi:protein-L-isoaspartate(D-aspartate) O-methyltransferase
MSEFAAARINMIESQVRPNGITDRRIIAAMEGIAREAFVPPAKRTIAYVDEDVALAPSDFARGPRYLIEAMALARMLQHAAVRPGDNVLTVGAGTGYGAAVMAALGRSVTALECDAGLAEEARRNLGGYANVTVVEGLLEGGAPATAPFDVIVVEGCVEEVPQALFAQLADQGRLVAVVGEADMAKAIVHTKSGNVVAAREVFDASIARLPGFEKKKPAFVF